MKTNPTLHTKLDSPDLDSYSRLARSLKNCKPNLFQKVFLGGTFLAAVPSAAFTQGICHQVLNLTLNNTSLAVDFDLDGETEFNVRHGGASANGYYRFPSNSASGIKTVNGRPTRLNAGAVISVAAPGMADAPTTGFFTRTTYGNWLNPLNTPGESPISGFWGFRFKDFNGNMHNGWMQIELKDKTPGPSYLRIIDYAYAIGTNAQITAGQTGPAGACIVLPVELTSFKAIENNESIQLLWETASETNNAGFEVQRSENGKDFLSLHFVPGTESSAAINTYSYTDSTIKKGQTYYYQLKQIDHNGAFSQSKIISAKISTNTQIISEFFPNPSEDKSYLDVNLTHDSEVNITLYDFSGRTVRQETHFAKSGHQQISLDTKGLNPAVYFAKISIGNEQVYRKISVSQD